MLLLLVLAVCSSAVASVPVKYVGIIGGRDAQYSRYPYLVSVQVEEKTQQGDKTFRHRCSGVIISDVYVLTSGICVSGVQARQIKIWSNSGSTMGSNGKFSLVEAVSLHPRYSENGHGVPLNDLAVLRALKPFSIDPVELAWKKPEPGDLVWTGGWLMGRMAEVQTPVIGREACTAAYADFHGIEDEHICAGILGTGGKDACEPGAPMILDGKIVAISTWAQGCALPLFPRVYTRLEYHQGWIQEQLEELYEK